MPSYLPYGPACPPPFPQALVPTLEAQLASSGAAYVALDELYEAASNRVSLLKQEQEGANRQLEELQPQLHTAQVRGTGGGRAASRLE